MENFKQVKKHFIPLTCKKRLDKHVLVGDFNFPEVWWHWSEVITTVQLYKKFLDIFLVYLGHSQMISEPTNNNINILHTIHKYIEH